MTVKELMELDIEFCNDVRVHGAIGWVKRFIDNGTMLTKEGDNIHGYKAILAAMESFLTLPNASITWEPEGGSISSEGDLGYTYGRYSREYTDDLEVKHIETGRYMTVWEKQDNGQYKIKLDMGN